MDTKGFYKRENVGDDLMYAPNFIDAPDYNLRAEDKDTYEYPTHGWYWFDSEEEAKEFFKIA